MKKVLLKSNLECDPKKCGIKSAKNPDNKQKHFYLEKIKDPR